MPYLIDGHNLIPKIGLHLDSADDEMELVGIIQEFARLSRRSVEIYFDGAPAGQPRTKKFGTGAAHFVRMSSSADAAIKTRIRNLGPAARNWSVVTSDRDVQSAARAAHAEVVSSEDFARRLKQLQQSSEGTTGERKVTPEEVQEWLRLFGGKQ